MDTGSQTEITALGRLGARCYDRRGAPLSAARDQQEPDQINRLAFAGPPYA